MNIHVKANTLYYGDCLDIMGQFPDNYVDLICLDPPFNSNRNYNTIFKRSGLKNIDPQIKAFDDTWTWNPISAERVEHVKSAIANPASKVIAAFETFIPRSKMLSYTSYMAERLFQMWRILKDTGSLYLHCDPYASHYLKLIMDVIFGEKHFRNEIVWCYTGPSNTKRWFPRKHDILLLYVKSEKAIFNSDAIRIPYSESFVNRRKYSEGDSGIAAGYSEGRDTTEIHSSFGKGKLIEDYWTDIPSGGQISKKELLGYPTQKPLRLYERLIKASSNEDDLVLDPFCGCGTTVDAALKNRRRVIGIDVLPFALRLINERRLSVPLPVEGIPVSFETAEQLAEMPKGYQKFQDWAVSLVDGLASNPVKVGDEGIDGFGMMAHKPDNMEARAILVQVTAASGSQNVKFGKLQDDVRNHNAAMGILITKDEQTARHRWHVNLPHIKMGETFYEPMQCLSIEEYYRNGKHYSPPLNLPALTNPWTGKPIQATLFDAV